MELVRGCLIWMSLCPLSTWFLLSTSPRCYFWRDTDEREFRPLLEWREFSVGAPFHSRSTPRFSPASAHLRSRSFHQPGKYLSSFCPSPLLSPPRCHSSHLDKLSTHHHPCSALPTKFSSIVSPWELVRLTLPYPATHTAWWHPLLLWLAVSAAPAWGRSSAPQACAASILCDCVSVCVLDALICVLLPATNVRV